MAGRKKQDGTFDYAIVIPFDPDNSPIVQITGAPRYHANDTGGERLNDDVRQKAARVDFRGCAEQLIPA